MLAISEGLRGAPEHALGVATNGTWSVGLRTADANAMKDQARVQSALSSREFGAYIARACKELRSKEQGKKLLELVLTINEAAGGKQWYDAACERVHKTIKDLPETCVERERQMDDRKTRDGLEYARMETSDSPAEAAGERVACEGVTFVLAACKTPVDPAKPTRWVEKTPTFTARAGLIPMVAVSETHVAVLYCDALTSRDQYDVTLRYWSLPGRDGRMRETMQWKQQLRFHALAPNSAATICFSIRPSAPHIAVVALGSHAYFVDVASRICTYYQLAPNRTVSCALAADDQSWFFGTTQGEVYHLGQGVFVAHILPHELPVLQVAWSPASKVLAARTWSNVFVVDKEGNRMHLDTVLPCCIAVSERELGILTGRGHIQVRPFQWILNAEVRHLEPPRDTLYAAYSFAYNQLLHLGAGTAVAIDSAGHVRRYE